MVYNCLLKKKNLSESSRKGQAIYLTNTKKLGTILCSRSNPRIINTYFGLIIKGISVVPKLPICISSGGDPLLLILVSLL